MNSKSHFVSLMENEFKHWEELLASLSEEQINEQLPSSKLLAKDLVAHLRAWQQISIARLEAALSNKNPELPQWLAGQDPNSDENLDDYNERIYMEYYKRPWQEIYQVWKEGFLRFIELAKAIPEKDFLEVGKYPWLEEYPLSAVLDGSCEHHEEHRKYLLALFNK